MVSREAGCYFSSLVSTETCFVSKYVINFGESSMSFWEEGIFFWVWMKCFIKISYRSIWSATSTNSKFFLFSVWMTCLLARGWYSVRVCVILVVEMFLLWVWVPSSLVHRCSKLQHLFGGFFLWVYCIPPCLFWLVLNWHLFCQIFDKIFFYIKKCYLEIDTQLEAGRRAFLVR